MNSRIKDNVRLFKYKVYEGYRPHNLAQTRDYIQFLIKDHGLHQVQESQIPKDILAYLRTTLKTKLPSNISETKIL